MFKGYLEFGGNEVGNNARAYGYASTADCPARWVLNPDLPGFNAAVGDGAYSYATISEAPWYDPDEPELSSRFFGLSVLDIKGLPDSTREASITQKNGPGAQVSGYRHAAREVRVRGWLTAAGEDALEAGMTWLRNVLEPDACGVHGGICGTAELAFFVSKPPPQGELTPEEYNDLIAPLRRYLHSVRAISGPFELSERTSNDGIHRGRLVEFTLVAEVPWVYGITKEVDVPPMIPTIVQDIVFNLAEYPSAELADPAPLLVATNYSTNPSVETDTTGWSIVADGSSILGGNVAGARSTELAAVGAASYKSTFTSPGTSAVAGWLGAQQTVTLPAWTTEKFSITVWASGLVQSGTAVLDSVDAVAYWQDAASVTLRTDPLGTLPPGGGPMAASTITPPAGATKVIVRTRLHVTSRSAGAVLALYTDALAVTKP